MGFAEQRLHTVDFSMEVRVEKGSAWKGRAGSAPGECEQAPDSWMWRGTDPADAICPERVSA